MSKTSDLLAAILNALKDGEPRNAREVYEAALLESGQVSDVGSITKLDRERVIRVAFTARAIYEPALLSARGTGASATWALTPRGIEIAGSETPLLLLRGATKDKPAARSKTLEEALLMTLGGVRVPLKAKDAKKRVLDRLCIVHPSFSQFEEVQGAMQRLRFEGWTRVTSHGNWTCTSDGFEKVEMIRRNGPSKSLTARWIADNWSTAEPILRRKVTSHLSALRAKSRMSGLAEEVDDALNALAVRLLEDNRLDTWIREGKQVNLSALAFWATQSAQDLNSKAGLNPVCREIFGARTQRNLKRIQDGRPEDSSVYHADPCTLITRRDEDGTETTDITYTGGVPIEESIDLSRIESSLAEALKASGDLDGTIFRAMSEGEKLTKKQQRFVGPIVAQVAASFSDARA